MKIPNKIYVLTMNNGDNTYSVTTTINPANKKYEVEYVNKNTLLEWIKEEKMKLKTEGSSNSDMGVGIISGLNRIVDKLNSL